MTRRFPIVATLLVLAAVAAMIALGMWQLRRLHWKEALLARYQSAAAQTAANIGEVAWPRDASAVTASLYRRSGFVCARVTSGSSIAGRNLQGESGLARLVHCELAGGGSADLVLGWSRAPVTPDWRGGEVRGVIAPGGQGGAHLVADPPLAGLAPNAKPDPRDIPNNHFAYAMQWFLFAATALVIYAIAVWKRVRGK